MASRDRSPQAQFFPRFCEENEECTPLKGPRAQVRSPGRMNKGVVGRPGGKNSAMQSNAITVTLGTKAGSAPLVYQVDLTNGLSTVSPVDVSIPAGQSTLSTNLVANTAVLANGIPQADGTIEDYVLFYYTGAALTAASALN